MMEPVQPTSLLKFSNVRKTYESEYGEPLLALDALDISIEKNEIVVLLGPTGCGKTTALNMALGLESPDTGTVLLGEEVIRGRNMPCVFQHYTLFPWRNILRNVTFGLEMNGVSRKESEERALGLLESVGISFFANSQPHELSGGMRQRAAIAQALAVDPRLLLMDEPFGALDDATRNELQKTLIEIWKEQKFSILFVTHSIDEAIILGTRIIVMSARPGKVAKEFGVELPWPRDITSKPFTSLLVKIRQTLARQIAE